MTSFASRVLAWYSCNGRKQLPWQQDPSPYRVWVSEIMLQQTQVNTVIPYYQRFMQRFPTVEELASADIDQVLHLWTGLGYYARARNLHKTAGSIVNIHQGKFPPSVDALNALPGIGRSTAGAIAALAMHIRAPILDGNVKRVLTRHYAIEGWPDQSSIKNQLWDIAEANTPKQRVADYTQAMMDLGSLVCTRSKPDCAACPLRLDCKALSEDCVGSFPTPKPRKPLPIKSVTMYVIQNDAGEVLLEKRPPTGIWGALYSLPESPSNASTPDISHVSVSSASASKMDPIRHTFSHFHLDITPIKLRGLRKPDEVADSDRWLWYPLDHSLEVGLAAPVKKLLSTLAQD